MDFRAARDYRLNFGRYVGSTLDEIAETDEGLKYLDWLFGEFRGSPETREALRVYLSDPTIAKELRNIL